LLKRKFQRREYFALEGGAESAKESLGKLKSGDTLRAASLRNQDADQRAEKYHARFPESPYRHLRSGKRYFERLFVEDHHQSNIDMSMLSESLLSLTRELRPIREKFQFTSTMTSSTASNLHPETTTESMVHASEGLQGKSIASRRLKQPVVVTLPETIIRSIASVNKGNQRNITLWRGWRRSADAVQAEITMKNGK
jgi:hypothetical protein